MYVEVAEVRLDRLRAHLRDGTRREALQAAISYALAARFAVRLRACCRRLAEDESVHKKFRAA